MNNTKYHNMSFLGRNSKDIQFQPLFLSDLSGKYLARPLRIVIAQMTNSLWKTLNQSSF